MRMSEQGEVFDYVVVGAGTAGCVLASRLSEDRNTRVALIEAGPMDRHPFITFRPRSARPSVGRESIGGS